MSLYVITEVPCETPVTRPVELIDATPVLADDQGDVAFGVPDPVNWVVNPTQTDKVPLIVGKALIVTVKVS